MLNLVYVCGNVISVQISCRLNILLNGLHEQDPIRYDVYCTQLEVAGQEGLIELIPTSLDKVPSTPHNNTYI